MITDPCSSCGGEGRRRKHRKLEVNIPAGVEEGSRIQVEGQKLRYHQDHKMVINLDSLGKECQL